MNANNKEKYLNFFKLRFTKLYSIIFILISFSLSAQNIHNNVAFNKLLEDYSEEGLVLNPIGATFKGDNRFNDKLPNNTVEERQKGHDYNIKFQKLLHTFKRDSLNSFDKISYDILELELKNSFYAEQFHFEFIPFNQIGGLPGLLPSIGSGKGLQPFKTAIDYYNWLKRLDAFTVWVDTAIANFNKGIEAGVVLPKALVAKMIPQLEAQTSTDTAKNIFFGPLKYMPASFTESEKTKIKTDFESTILTKVIPTYKKLATYLQTIYLPKARTTAGYNALPKGSSMYQFFVAQSTTTAKTPEEIYQTGLNEVSRITKEIESLKTKVDFKGSLPELFNFTLNDKQFFPFTSDEQILSAYRALLLIIEPSLKKLFNIVPKSAFEVRAIDKFKAKTASANYQRGALDGSRPGYFNVPIVDPAKYNKLGMENLFLHEAIPGHHFQLSIQMENKALPEFRKLGSFSAFTEGWALYTESLGTELGLYTDPYQHIAAYKGELLRAIRLVTDVGLHTGKMTREESIKYMMEKGGKSEEASIQEIERYMANPGQALSYKIGELKIKELKVKYQKQLGKKFNIKDFHDAILLVGSVPLSVFETYMEEWATNISKD